MIFFWILKTCWRSPSPSPLSPVSTLHTIHRNMFIWTPNPYNLLPYCQVSLNTRVCSLDVFQCLVSCQFDIAFIVVLSWQSSQEAALFLCSGESTGFWFHDIAVVRPWPPWPLSLASALDKVVVHKLEEWDGAAREPLGAVPGQLRGQGQQGGLTHVWEWGGLTWPFAWAAKYFLNLASVSSVA